MTALDIRLRPGWLFTALTVGHIVLISAQVNTRRGVPLLEEVTFGTFAEVQRWATSLVGGIRDGWQNYVAVQQIRRDNEQLTKQVAELEISLQQERALADQTRTLQDLLELRRGVPWSTTAGNVTESTVIGAGASPEFRTISIDKGTGDGLRADMAVLAPAGVVGRIIMPARRASKVQLLIDRNAGAGALVERSRAQGVVIGTGDGSLLMEYVSSAADVEVGDVVVTSGADTIYPKGFVIGRIESVQRGAGSFSAIVIRPAVDFSTLEAVLVVLDAPPAPPDASESEAR